jgi:hypothetical protein
MTPTLERIPEDEIRTLEVYQHSPIHHKFPICNRGLTIRPQKGYSCA